MSLENRSIFDYLLECASTALNHFNRDDDDNMILLSLLDCCETAMITPPTKIPKRAWIKPSREDNSRVKSYSFIKEMNALGIDESHADLLLLLIKKDVTRQNTLMRGAIPPEKRLACILRNIILGESYKATDMYTKLSSAFISHAKPEVCEAIWKNLKETFLKFPDTAAEWENISYDFDDKWQFPNCIGALHCRPISYRWLRRDGTVKNKQGTASTLLIALVDASGRFIYVDVDCSSGTNLAEAFAETTLKKFLDNPTSLPQARFIGRGRRLPYVVISDGDFPLQQHIMKPYPDDHTLPWDKNIFNNRLMRARGVADHAFDLLFDRFKIFQTATTLRFENINIITMACCVLHNFLMDNEDCYQRDFHNMTNTASTEVQSKNSRKDSKEAERIRQDFMNFFNEEGAVS